MLHAWAGGDYFRVGGEAQVNALLRLLQIEFLVNLLEGLRTELWVCQSPGRWRIVWTIIAT